MSEQPVIRTQGLTKYFGAKPAVYELSLEVPRGSVFAFLGRNGSGKTTFIRMLLGLLQPTRGDGSILGEDIRTLRPEARARIGYLTEEHQLYSWMKVRECGEFQAQFYPRWNDKVFRGVIGHFALRPDARVKDLSRGERAGLCLGLTLAPEPELLILDDPALGLDPVARRSLVESMIFLTRRSDRTIFFSSHDLADVERVADYIAVLDRSVLRACCSLETFRTSVRQVRLQFPGTPPPVPPIPGLLQAFRAEGELRLACVHYNGATDKALRALNPEQMETVPISLEDAFISYLGERGEKSFILAETGSGESVERHAQDVKRET
jgi:ABC-2 type transport system ATP-binding protein